MICTTKSVCFVGLWHHLEIIKRKRKLLKIRGAHGATFCFLWVPLKVNHIKINFLIELIYYKCLFLDSSLPTVKLSVEEGRNGLWGKTREAFRYIWNNYRDQADWFFKADDDTLVKWLIFVTILHSFHFKYNIICALLLFLNRYVIVENLRYFLSGYNTTEALWFGHKFKTIVKQGYFSGGAGECAELNSLNLKIIFAILSFETN